MPALQTPARPRQSKKQSFFTPFPPMQGFGGVLAVVQRELAEKRKWLTAEEFVEDWAVAQILPGPNVVNLSLMLGDRYFGWRGALTGVAGMLCFPTIVVLLPAACSPAWPTCLRYKVPCAAWRCGRPIAGGRFAGEAHCAVTRWAFELLGLGGSHLVAVALVRLPLAWLLLTGLPACLWAYHRLGWISAASTGKERA